MKKAMHKRPAANVTYTFKKILTGSDLSRRRLPFMAAETGVPGPVVWLTACSHGDEVGGIVIIQEIFRGIRKRKSLIKGSVFAFPLMNPIGFEAKSRHIPYSQEDLNRSFPGDPKGSVGERLADLVFTSIMETDPALVVDMHNDWIRSIPYALIDTHPGAAYETAYRKTENFALLSGLLSIRDTEMLPKTLSHALHHRHVPCLTLELGESYVVNEKNIAFGVQSVENIMVYLGMMMASGPGFRYPVPEICRQTVLDYGLRPFAATSGIIRFLVKAGDIVAAGQPIARIYNTFGKLQETMKAEKKSIVLGHTDSSVAFPGMPVMAFGVI